MQAFRPEVYDALLGTGDPAPISVVACDGIDFDGLSVAEYLRRFALSTPFGSVDTDIQP